MSSTTTIDPTTDNNGTVLAQIAKRYELPDFVKSAELDHTMRPEDLPSSSYAWPQQKKYPCHSSAATWLSSAYFFDKVASFRAVDKIEIENRLEKFANYFGIRPAYDAIKQQAAEKNKATKLADDQYAFVYVDENGNKEGFYPLTDGVAVKAAVYWLQGNQGRIPYSQRNEIANKIINRVNNMGVKLAQDEMYFLEKQSGDGIPRREELLSAIDLRVKLASSHDQKQGMQSLLEVVRSTPKIVMQKPELVKLAATLDVFDAANGLLNKYTDIIRRPEDVVFAVTPTKVANDEASKITLTNGSVYNRDDLEKVSYDDLREVLGDDFAAEVSSGFSVDTTKLAEIAATLPASDASLLDTVLKASGSMPVGYANKKKVLL